MPVHLNLDNRPQFTNLDPKGFESGRAKNKADDNKQPQPETWQGLTLSAEFPQGDPEPGGDKRTLQGQAYLYPSFEATFRVKQQRFSDYPLDEPAYFPLEGVRPSPLSAPSAGIFTHDFWRASFIGFVADQSVIFGFTKQGIYLSETATEVEANDMRSVADYSLRLEIKNWDLEWQRNVFCQLGEIDQALALNLYSGITLGEKNRVVDSAYKYLDAQGRPKIKRSESVTEKSWDQIGKLGLELQYGWGEGEGDYFPNPFCQSLRSDGFRTYNNASLQLKISAGSLYSRRDNELYPFGQLAFEVVSDRTRLGNLYLGFALGDYPRGLPDHYAHERNIGRNLSGCGFADRGRAVYGRLEAGLKGLGGWPLDIYGYLGNSGLNYDEFGFNFAVGLFGRGAKLPEKDFQPLPFLDFGSKSPQYSSAYLSAQTGIKKNKFTGDLLQLLNQTWRPGLGGVRDLLVKRNPDGSVEFWPEGATYKAIYDPRTGRFHLLPVALDYLDEHKPQGIEPRILYQLPLEEGCVIAEHMKPERVMSPAELKYHGGAEGLKEKLLEQRGLLLAGTLSHLPEDLWPCNIYVFYSAGSLAGFMKDGDIYLNCYPWVNGLEDRHVQDHEIGHVVDSRTGGRDDDCQELSGWFSDSHFWDELYILYLIRNGQEFNLSVYAEKKRVELFAEMFADYIGHQPALSFPLGKTPIPIAAINDFNGIGASCPLEGSLPEAAAGGNKTAQGIYAILREAIWYDYTPGQDAAKGVYFNDVTYWDLNKEVTDEELTNFWLRDPRTFVNCNCGKKGPRGDAELVIDQRKKVYSALPDRSIKVIRKSLEDLTAITPRETARDLLSSILFVERKAAEEKLSPLVADVDLSPDLYDLIVQVLRDRANYPLPDMSCLGNTQVREIAYADAYEYDDASGCYRLGHWWDLVPHLILSLLEEGELKVVKLLDERRLLAGLEGERPAREIDLNQTYAFMMKYKVGATPSALGGVRFLQWEKLRLATEAILPELNAQLEKKDLPPVREIRVLAVDEWVAGEAIGSGVVIAGEVAYVGRELLARPILEITDGFCSAVNDIDLDNLWRIQGEAFFRQGDYQSAIALLTRIRDKEKGGDILAKAHWNLAKESLDLAGKTKNNEDVPAEETTANFKAAAENFEAYIALTGAAGEALFYLAQSYWGLADYQKAIPLLEKAISANDPSLNNPRSIFKSKELLAVCYFEQARLHVSRGENKEAVGLLRKYLSLRPGDKTGPDLLATALWNQACRFDEEADYSEAIDALTGYLALKPDDPEGFSARGRIYRKIYDENGQKKYLKKSREDVSRAAYLRVKQD